MPRIPKKFNMKTQLLIISISPTLFLSQGFAAPLKCAALFSTKTFSAQANFAALPIAPVAIETNAQTPSGFSQHSARGALLWEGANAAYQREIDYAGIHAKKIDIDGNPIDWKALSKNFVRNIRNNVYTFADYDLAIAQYYMRGNDAHTSISLYSTYTKYAPFQLSPVDADAPEGLKFAINFIDNSFTPPTNVRAPQPGDHVIAMNGKSVDEFRKQTNSKGDYVLPQTLFVGKESSSQYIFGLSNRAVKESRGNLLTDLGDSITYRIQPQDGTPAYDITYPYKISGVPLLRQPVRPDAPIILQPAQVPAQFLATLSTSKITVPLNLSKTLSLTERVSSFLKDRFALAQSNLKAKLPARKVPTFPALMSKTVNAATFEIYQSATNLMHAGVEQIKKEAAVTPIEGVGVQIGMGQQMPFVNFEALGEKFKRIQMPEDSRLPSLRAQFNDDFFYAGTYMKDGVRIGVLRIPSYEPSNMDTMLPSLRYFITRLQSESDVLIIDQTYNPGGLVIFSDMLIRSLVGKYDTSKHLAFAVRPSPRFLSEYSNILEAVRANTDQLLKPEEVIEFTRRFTDEYNKIRSAARLPIIDYNGNELPAPADIATAPLLPLSDPITMTVMSDYVQLTTDRILQTQPDQKALYSTVTQVLGIDLTHDSPQSFYSKKVVFWVNAPCFSGGDATPVSFKGYLRGPLVGDDTGGAGGTVEAYSATGLRDNPVKFISSLMIKAGNTTEQLLKTGAGQVEQVGAKVDFRIMPSTKDITTGGVDSFHKITDFTLQYYKSSAKP
jgi:hypothetical protein